jgi:hypothetical protein
MADKTLAPVLLQALKTIEEQGNGRIEYLGGSWGIRARGLFAQKRVLPVTGEQVFALEERDLLTRLHTNDHYHKDDRRMTDNAYNLLGER